MSSAVLVMDPEVGAGPLDELAAIGVLGAVCAENHLPK
jgi:hypothetical protein